VALRDSSAFLSELKEWLQPGATVLDLGCGPRDQQRPVESLGFRYFGVDVDSTAADLLVDAHCLPFHDQSFDAVLSYAVLEHLRDPFVALREITLVLKPGGLYLGTVSQGEPFHASYLHHSAWALLSIFSSQPELETLRLWAAIVTLESLARMGRYPKVIRKALAGLHRLQLAVPQLAPRKLRWPRKMLQIAALYRAGSIGFVTEKRRINSMTLASQN
jgi:SAM-dependent methyltransferase